MARVAQAGAGRATAKSRGVRAQACVGRAGVRNRGRVVCGTGAWKSSKKP